MGGRGRRRRQQQRRAHMHTRTHAAERGEALPKTHPREGEDEDEEEEEEGGATPDVFHQWHTRANNPNTWLIIYGSELELYFNLILRWAGDESFILQRTGDGGESGAQPTQLREYDSTIFSS